MSLRCEMSRERKLKLSLVESYNKANIFLGLIEYELNSLLGASHLVDYISVHIRFDLERYLLIITTKGPPTDTFKNLNIMGIKDN